MIDSIKDSTELEKRILNQQNLDSFSLSKKILVRIQEIIMSLATDETTDVIRKFEKMYIRVDSSVDTVISDGYKWNYRMALFQRINSMNYLFRVEARFETTGGLHKNMVYNYPLIGRRRYDLLQSDLLALIRNTRLTEYQNAKA